MPTPAREAAFHILLRVEQRQAHASELLHSARLDKLSPPDRALCTELVMGVLRWRARLDSGIGAVASQPLTRTDNEVLTALRLGAYQIAFMRLPARAAVNESVELVKRARKRYSAPFVNAVLRKLVSRPELLHPTMPPGPRTAAELARLWSHPLWLVERWAAHYGMEAAEKICACGQQVPPVAIRLGAAAEEQLRAERIELKPGALLASARIVTGGDLAHSRALAGGRVAIQDEASQLVALLVGRGERLLDCCAAPGGKTAVLVERNPRSLIVAADLHPRRASLLRQRLQGAANVRIVAADAAALPVAANFDRVLADVPCSGTGTLARNPEIKWRLEPKDLDDLHQRQARILRAALDRLAPGGRLVYATCSLEPEENEAVVNEAVGNGFRIADCREELRKLKESGELVWADVDALTDGPYLRTIPGVHPCDGFFASVIVKV